MSVIMFLKKGLIPDSQTHQEKSQDVQGDASHHQQVRPDRGGQGVESVQSTRHLYKQQQEEEVRPLCGQRRVVA
jgi:hypothetical protein